MSRDTLFISDDDRYDRLRLISWWDQDKLAAAKILVVGAGALGNEVLKNLVLLGVGKIYLIDFDLMESSNLSRSVFFRADDRGKPKADLAAERAAELNPDVTIVPIHGNVMTDIGLGFLKSMDLVIGCLDNREARLWVNRMCWKACVPWIDGGIQEINGVAKVYQPPGGACYECTMTANDYRLINLRYSCPLLKQEDIQAGRVPTAPTIASMIGALQVQEALKLLHQIPTDAGTALVFNGLSNQFYKSTLPRREDCLSHDTYETIQEIPLDHCQTLNALFQTVAQQLDNETTLVLDRDFVQQLECDACQSIKAVSGPALLLSQKDAICQCGQPMRPVMISEVTQTHLNQDSKIADRPLKDLGIPDWDIIKLVTQEGTEVHWQLRPTMTEST